MATLLPLLRRPAAGDAPSSAKGQAPLDLYYVVGALLQLNWLDRSASLDLYTESKVQNVFLLVEVRQYLNVLKLKVKPAASQGANNNKLASEIRSGPHINLGLLVEF